MAQGEHRAVRGLRGRRTAWEVRSHGSSRGQMSTNRKPCSSEALLLECRSALVCAWKAQGLLRRTGSVGEVG